MRRYYCFCGIGLGGGLEKMIFLYFVYDLFDFVYRELILNVIVIFIIIIVLFKLFCF